VVVREALHQRLTQVSGNLGHGFHFVVEYGAVVVQYPHVDIEVLGVHIPSEEYSEMLDHPQAVVSNNQQCMVLVGLVHVGRVDELGLVNGGQLLAHGEEKLSLGTPQSHLLVQRELLAVNIVDEVSELVENAIVVALLDEVEVLLQNESHFLSQNSSSRTIDDWLNAHLGDKGNHIPSTEFRVDLRTNKSGTDWRSKGCRLLLRSYYRGANLDSICRIYRRRI